jgi:ABC-type antimicrobial peptide transport system permease subunit
VALSKVLASFMFGVSALDSATFAGAALLLTLVAGVALYLPSRRAATVDPVIVLREA